MTRIRFENLPSTSTPRNAENLNKLNNVVISSTEPTTGEEVWLEKGNNLFDKSNANIVNLYPASTQTLSQNAYKSVLLDCKPNTTYTASYSTSISSDLIIASYSSLPSTSVMWNVRSINPTNNTISITTGANDIYLLCYVFYGSDTTALQNILNSLQIEYGSTATTYEEFKPHKIYENKDGYYDLFTETVSVGNTVGNGRVNFIKGKNLYNKNASLDGYALSSSSGKIVANAGWTTSDFIPVVPNASIYISGKPTQGNGVCCYNASKTFVSTVTCREGTMTTPVNCYYIRINLAIADKDTCQVEISDDITSYEPYVDRAIVVDGEEIYKKGFEEYSITSYAATDCTIYNATDGSYIKKNDKLIILSANMQCSSLTANTGKTIMNLPNMFAPKKTALAIGVVHQNTTNITPALITINPNGTVTIYSSQSGNKQIIFEITYTLY